jgi:hypothetical protein
MTVHSHKQSGVLGDEKLGLYWLTICCMSLERSEGGSTGNLLSLSCDDIILPILQLLFSSILCLYDTANITWEPRARALSCSFR